MTMRKQEVKGGARKKIAGQRDYAAAFHKVLMRLGTRDDGLGLLLWAMRRMCDANDETASDNLQRRV